MILTLTIKLPPINTSYFLEIFLFAYFGCKVAMIQLASYLDIEHLTENYFEEVNVEYLSNINN